MVFLFFIFLTNIVHADRMNPGCHDFSKKIVEPIRPALPLAPEKDASELGELPNGLDWASARGGVKKTIKVVYELLLDHYVWKPSEKHSLVTIPEDKPGYLAFHHLKDKLSISLALFSTSISWEEDWAYALVQGTKEEPKVIVVSYEKTSGTSYLEHLCGSVVLSQLPDKSTDVYLYQQLKASHQNAEDILKGALGTLKTLRQ